MKTLAFAIALTLPIAGCAGTDFGKLSTGVANVLNASVTQQQLDEARLAYNGLFLTPAVHYRRLPRCTVAPAPCSDRAKIAQLQAIDKVVKANFDSTQALISQGQDANAAWVALNAAISSAKALIQGV